MYVNSLSVGSRLLPLSFEIKRGEIIHVIGPNGSGKSTLLSAVGGLLGYKGSVTLTNQQVSDYSLDVLAQKRAFLSQSDRPAFNIEVIQYLSLSLPDHVSIESEEVKRVLCELTELLEIDDKLHRSIHHLSGGEWQRVRLCAICLQIWRSLNPYSELLILDEPAAPLDIGQEVLLYRLIDRVAEMGVSVLMSNHDLNRTLKHADKALLLNQGVLHSFGQVADVLNSQSLSDVYRTQVKLAEVEGGRVLLFE